MGAYVTEWMDDDHFVAFRRYGGSDHENTRGAACYCDNPDAKRHSIPSTARKQMAEHRAVLYMARFIRWIGGPDA